MSAVCDSQMGGRECHDCKAWIAEDQAYDCWMTTETALNEDLSEHLSDVWDGYARPPFLSATGAFTRPVPRSCSSGRRAISLCAHGRVSGKCVYSSAASVQSAGTSHREEILVVARSCHSHSAPRRGVTAAHLTRWRRWERVNSPAESVKPKFQAQDGSCQAVHGTYLFHLHRHSEVMSK
jgi:hypothetical protein